MAGPNAPANRAGSHLPGAPRSEGARHLLTGASNHAAAAEGLRNEGRRGTVEALAGSDPSAEMGQAHRLLLWVRIELTFCPEFADEWAQ